MSILNWLAVRLSMERDDWPPPALRAHWDRIAEYRRYFESDYERMLQHAPAFNISDEKKKLYTPVPLAAEICGYSADLLFSEEPDVTHEDHQDTLNEVLEANGLPAMLLETAAKIATEGRGAIRVERDDEVADVPILTYVPEDNVLWDLRHGRFVAGGWVVIERKKNRWATDVYRLVEEHRPGFIERALFKGRDRTLGEEVPLNTIDEFAELEPLTQTGLDRPTLVLWNNVPGGKSDIAGQLTLLDRLNEAESLGIDKLRKSIPITFADRKLADRQGNVELYGVILTGGRESIAGDGVAKTVETVQHQFQSEDHLRYVRHVRDLIVTTSGYSLESFGEATKGRAESGRALRLRMTRTLLKKAGKDRMAREAIRNALATAVAWQSGAKETAPFRPKVELGDGMPRDELEIAQVIGAMEAAGAVSTETKVRMFHPDWTDEQVQSEVERIIEENRPPQVTMPDLADLDGDLRREGARHGG